MTTTPDHPQTSDPVPPEPAAAAPSDAEGTAPSDDRPQTPAAPLAVEAAEEPASEPEEPVAAAPEPPVETEAPEEPVAAAPEPPVETEAPEEPVAAAPEPPVETEAPEEPVAAAPEPPVETEAPEEPVDAVPEPPVETEAPEEPVATDASEESEEDLTPAARDFRAAMRAAKALGLAGEKGTAAEGEDTKVSRLASDLGLDRPSEPAAPVPAFPEPPAEQVEEAEEAEEEDPFLGPEPTDARAWYVINTYSGHETRVETNLKRRIESMDVADRIFRVVVPTEEILEIRGGQRRQVSRKLLPGYVLVEMLMEDETWYVVRNTPGVTGFVGAARPAALARAEVKAIMQQTRVAEPRIRVGFATGDSVRVVDGPFADFIAEVDEINLDKGKVRVLISMFGRDTPVELDLLQVEKG